MNKRYIDFVPTKNEKKVAPRSASGTKQYSRSAGTNGSYRINNTATRSARSVTQVKAVSAKNVPTRSTAVRSTFARSAASGAVSSRNTVTGATRASVEKRPVAGRIISSSTASRDSALAQGAGGFSLQTPALGEIEDLSSKFVKTEVSKRPLSEKPKTDSTKQVTKSKTRKFGARFKSKTEEKPAVVATSDMNKATKTTSRAPFINQDKVVKRPLSNTVSKKAPQKPASSPASGPVMVISKPEKDSKVGLVVTIIITIILGAAAGTIAFLLLPK